MAELRLSGATVVLDDEALDALADQLADRVTAQLNGAAPGGGSEAWLRGAKAAGEYLGCPRSRIYDLVDRGELRHERDGRCLMFRPEWLDAAFEGQS